jgi:hypothetical protein
MAFHVIENEVVYVLRIRHGRRRHLDDPLF